MMFMNEWDIERRNRELRFHPVLGPATQFLYDFQREVNQHSDGWPYWSAPVKAAKQLMILIERGEATPAEVKAALRPIKAFMTRRGTAAGMVLPVLKLGN
jgi:hypothetical protein